jgi:signal peptidase I
MEAATSDKPRHHGADPVGYVGRAEETSLPRQALLELLRAVLDRGVPFRFWAPGFSMSPFIRDGDVITVSRLRGRSPGPGRVVAFVRPGMGRLIVHRVVGKKGDSYMIKGDNSPEADALVPKGDILGYVSKVERDGKRVFLGLGPERFVIASLSRRGLLLPLLRRVGWLVHPFIRRELT